MRVFGRILPASLLFTVLTTALAVPAIAEPSRSERLSAISIENFGAIGETYFRGSQPKGRDYADLKALGVKTVIDLQQDGDATEAALVEQAGMRYVRIPMTTRIVPSVAQIEQFLSLVNDPASQPVYVHCAGGRHRTGVMTALYRMTKDGWAAKQAFAEMKQYNFGADWLHPEFKKFVFDFTPAPFLPILAAATPAIGDQSVAAASVQ